MEETCIEVVSVELPVGNWTNRRNIRAGFEIFKKAWSDESLCFV